MFSSSHTRDMRKSPSRSQMTFDIQEFQNLDIKEAHTRWQKRSELQSETECLPEQSPGRSPLPIEVPLKVSITCSKSNADASSTSMAVPQRRSRSKVVQQSITEGKEPAFTLAPDVATILRNKPRVAQGLTSQGFYKREVSK